jgi:hypothetical protein
VRRIRILLALLALAASAGRAWPQSVDFHVSGDTAMGVLPATVVPVPVYIAGYSGVTTSRLTFFFDPAKITVTGVVGNSGVSPTLVPVAPGVVGVSTGTQTYYGGGTPTYWLQVQLQGGVTDGTYLWTRADTMRLSATDVTANYVTSIGRLCHATYGYGDVDGDGRVDSRDALITLSAAVGLPVTGYALDRADVDRDAATTSRDALMMLQSSIAIPIAVANRLGSGVPDGCPGMSSAPETVVFVRHPVGGTGYTDTLYTIAAGTSTPVPVPDSTATGRVFDPRLAADGISIVYGCYRLYPTLGSYYDQICAIHRDGTGFQALTPFLSANAQPDWSPSGAMVVWYNGGQLQVNPPIPLGLSQSPLLSLSSGSTPAWSPDSARIAFYSSGLRVINADGSGSAAVPPGNIYAQRVRWSPGSDSLAYVNSYNTVRITAAAGGGDRAAISIGLYYPPTFDWGASGFVFAMPENSIRPGFQGIWFVPYPEGPIQRLSSGPDVQPTFPRVR